MRGGQGRNAKSVPFHSIRGISTIPNWIFYWMESAQILEVLFRYSLKGKGISLPNLFKVFYLQFYRIIKRSGKQESSDFAAERL